jgi:signal transduction histidine kinase
MGPTLHEAANLSDLTALVTHEFNNHLNGIFLRLALLEQEFPEARDQLRVIRILGDEAAALIRRLQQANRPTIPPTETIDVNRIIREVVDKLLSTAAEQSVKVCLATDDLLTRGSSEDFRRLVALLLAHSVQAISGTGGTINIRTERAGPKVIVEMSDTGMGIPEELLPRAFDPFVAAREGTDDTSLGVSRMLVRRLHGEIRVANLAAQGVVFRVELSRGESQLNSGST